MLPYLATKTILSTARKRAGPEGRVGMDVRSLQASSTNAFLREKLFQEIGDLLDG
jgi:hypothetical protein